MTEGTLGAAIVGGAVTGAIGGATYSGVSSGLSGNSLKQVAKDTLTGGLTGAVAGGAMGGLAYGADKAIGAAKNVIKGSSSSPKPGHITEMATKDLKPEIPSEQKLKESVGEWAKMETKLAEKISKRKADRFNTASVVYDSGTGKYYYGMNKGLQISGDKLNETLAEALPKQSLNQYRVGNCAEVDAVNQALNNGSFMENLYIYTINTKTGVGKQMCENCVYTFEDKVAQVLSH